MKKTQLIIIAVLAIMLTSLAGQAQTKTMPLQVINQQPIQVIKTMNILLPDTLMAPKTVLFEVDGGKLGLNIYFDKYHYTTFFTAEKFKFKDENGRNGLCLTLSEEKTIFIVLRLSDEDIKRLWDICNTK